jgi:hypothetical protein
MSTLSEFISRRRGEERRAQLNKLLNYYIPPNLRPAANFLGGMTPSASYEGAVQGFDQALTPGASVSQRVGGIGQGLTGTAGIAAPLAVAKQAGMPAAQAVQEAFQGFSTGANYAGGVLADRLTQPGQMPTTYSNPVLAPFDAIRGMGDNGGPPLRDPLASVDDEAHSLPKYSGAAENRTTPYPRYRPAKTTDRMSRLESAVADVNNPIRNVFDKYIEKGITLRGPDWYNTEEMRDWFVGSLGQKEGDRQWREFMELIGTTSTGAKVPQNIRFASFYRALSPEDRTAVASLVNEKGITPRKAAEELGVLPPNMPEKFGYGHIKQRNMASNVVKREEGEWSREIPEELTGAARSKRLQANPKVKGFANDLLGDDTNIAADMHFMRMLAMADGGGDFLSAQAKLSKDAYAKAAEAIGPRAIKKYTSTRKVNGKPVSEVNLKKAWEDGKINDTSIFSSTPSAWADTPKANEYAAYEDMAKRVAAEYDMTPAQFQAALWMGAGDITGLADESQGTFMELFRVALDNRAAERGISRREMLEDFINNKGVLAVPAGAAISGGILGEEEQ